MPVGDVVDKSWLNGELDEEYATVRIAKVTLENFKSVRHGEITFDCGNRFVPAGTRSDILALYGQNGSGKTSLIEALSILERLMSGVRIHDVYAECIAADAEFARLDFEFDFQYPDGRRLRVGYAASIGREARHQEESQDADFEDSPFSSTIRYRVRVFDEVVKIGGVINGTKCQYRSCVDTSEGASSPFGPASRNSEFFEVTRKNREKLAANRILASERSKSFIFMNETMEIFSDQGNNKSQFFRVLAELNYFARYYLFVVDSKVGATTSLDYLLPVFTPRGMLPLKTSRAMNLPLRAAQDVRREFDAMNQVLGELVPGLEVDMEEIGAALLRDGSDGLSVEFVSRRNGLKFPLRDESDGIKKIISILNLVVAVFNQKSTTVAIDELDAGIFEYLLGEILQMVEDSGQGQLIFTSHNLRPLEVLDKRFVRFTTTNADNRYYQMKHVGSNNNLRDVFFREIVMGEQDEELYSSGKRFRIVSSLRRAANQDAL